MGRCAKLTNMRYDDHLTFKKSIYVQVAWKAPGDVTSVHIGAHMLKWPNIYISYILSYHLKWCAFTIDDGTIAVLDETPNKISFMGG